VVLQFKEYDVKLNLINQEKIEQNLSVKLTQHFNERIDKLKGELSNKAPV
jgi:hypothetical protein